MFRRLFPVSYRHTQKKDEFREYQDDSMCAPIKSMFKTVEQYEQQDSVPSVQIPRKIEVTHQSAEALMGPLEGPLEWVRYDTTLLDVTSRKKQYKACKESSSFDKSVTMRGENYSDDFKIVDSKGEKKDCFAKIYRYFKSEAAHESQKMRDALIETFADFACGEKNFSPELAVKKLEDTVNEPQQSNFWR